MMESALTLLDWLFHFLHFAVIVINSTFWMFKRTLLIAQVTQLLTFFSWIVLGPVYGFGYCFLTDWHWRVKETLGETGMPASYIKYAADALTGRDWPAVQIDIVTSVVAGLSFIGCAVQTCRHRSFCPGARALKERTAIRSS